MRQNADLGAKSLQTGGGTWTATLCCQSAAESRYADDDVLSEDVRKQEVKVS